MNENAAGKMTFRRLLSKWYFRAPIEIGLVLFVWFFVIQINPTHGPSMLPTLKDGSYVFLDKLSYRLHPPERGDVIVFRSNEEPVMHYCKRVIGLPGQVIEIRRGQVYLDDAPLHEPYIIGNTFWELQPTRIGEDQIYAIGDNRGMAIDSHFKAKVAYRNIVGRVIGKGYDYSNGEVR